MKSEFALALNQIGAERNLPREIITQVLESALIQSYRKNATVMASQNVAAKVDIETGDMRIFVEKEVVDEVLDDRTEVSLEEGFAHVDPLNTLNQLPQLRRLLPAIAPLSVIRTWSGVEGYMPDDIPIMGPSGKVSGLFYAFGFCGHGFQLGPGVGAALADLVLRGSTPTPLDIFPIARFATGQVAEADHFRREFDQASLAAVARRQEA